jgi:hypothetical protein
MKMSREVMPLKVPSTPQLLMHGYNHSKMTGVQTSEVDSELASVNVGP